MKARILTLAVLMALGLNIVVAQSNSSSDGEQGENSDGQ